jgi:hypothetical protein
MLDTYIKNRGMTKTIIHNNNHNTIDETNWDADYDGNVANISLDLSKNGKNNHFDFKLTNNDLANILTIPSISQPIHKRLKTDFKKPESLKQIFLEIEPESSDSEIDSEIDFDNIDSPIQQLLTHISSPVSNEEFVMPFQDYSLQSEQPLIKILHAPSKTKSHRLYKSKRHSKRPQYFKSSKLRKKHKHHNYPSTRKSRKHTFSRKS